MTRGLLEMLSRDELQAVVAHEVAHIRNGDARLLTLLAGMSRAVSILAPFALGPLGAAWTMALEGDGGDETSVLDEGPPSPVHEPLDAKAIRKGALLAILTPFAALALLVVAVAMSLTLVIVFAAVFMLLPLLALAWVVVELFGLDVLPAGIDGTTRVRWAGFLVPVGLLLGPAVLLVGIVAPFSVLAIRMALSRTREFEADAEAVELTRNPLGLLGALRKLGERPSPAAARRWPAALRPMCIRPPKDPETEGLLPVVLKELTPEELEEAKRLAESFVPAWQR